jgi:hypothetical protein
MRVEQEYQDGDEMIEYSFAPGGLDDVRWDCDGQRHKIGKADEQHAIRQPLPD